MPIQNRLLIIFVCYLFVSTANAQMANIFTKLPKEKWSGKWQTAKLTDKQKLERLSLLPAGDSVQFELPYYDSLNTTNDNRYFPLNLKGLNFLDLDFDGDLDLVYNGSSGWQTLMDTKVYLNENNRYQFLKILNGAIIDIHKTKNSYEIYTQWIPCCDSYTTRIEKTLFSKSIQGSFQESISIIGLNRLKAMPDFNGLKSGWINDTSLFATQSDFNGTYPYFGAQTKAASDSLRAKHPIKLINLTGRNQVRILDQKSVHGKEWYLIITEVIADAPKSRYEWSAGANRRFVGWVNHMNTK
jgi:hypothetical protein